MKTGAPRFWLKTFLESFEDWRPAGLRDRESEGEKTRRPFWRIRRQRRLEDLFGELWSLKARGTEGPQDRRREDLKTFRSTWELFGKHKLVRGTWRLENLKTKNHGTEGPRDWRTAGPKAHEIEDAFEDRQLRSFQNQRLKGYFLTTKEFSRPKTKKTILQD